MRIKHGSVWITSRECPWNIFFGKIQTSCYNHQAMKTSIHPNYNTDAQISCNSCGTKYQIGSTVDSLQIEVCGQCHPYYTGKVGNLVDSENTIKNYMARLEAVNSDALIQKKKKALNRRGSRVTAVDTTNKLTLKDMLKQVQS